MAFPPLYQYALSSGLLDVATLRNAIAAAIERNGHDPDDGDLAAELLEIGSLNPWQVSQLLEGRTRFTLSHYRIVDSLGQGGYGQVFLARDPRGRLSQTWSDSLVALKVLPLTKATPELIERFQREIDIQCDLNHPNLVKFIDSGHDANVHFMVHEYMNGGDLRQRIRQDDRISVAFAAKITMQIADAVAYLHKQGIVHRDIKPANILLSHNGDAKLADMGFAVNVDLSRDRENSTESMLNEAIEAFADSDNGGIGENSSNSGEISSEIQPETEIGRMKWKLHGTTDFMAPDQIRNPHSPSPGWDIYSLGCSLYQMTTGIVPFPCGTARQKIMAQLQQEPPDPRMFNQSLPFDIVALLWEMMAKNPEDRIDSLEEVRERLRPWSEEGQITAESHDFSGELFDKNSDDLPKSDKIVISSDEIRDISAKNSDIVTSQHILVPPILAEEVPTNPSIGKKSFLSQIRNLSDRQWWAIEVILTISLCFLAPIAIILLLFVVFYGIW